MTSRHELTTVETVEEAGSWRFSIRDEHGDREEAILVPCDDGGEEPVRAWINRCTHEAQRLHRDEVGAVYRNGEVVCPKHGSTFEPCSGDCDNGPAADTRLQSVDVEVADGQVYLVDEDVEFLFEGGLVGEEDDDGPDSTSHLRF